MNAYSTYLFLDRSPLCVAGNNLFPGITGRDYYVFYVPPFGAVPEGLYIAVDLLNFDSGDSATASLYIEDVEVKEFELPE